MDLNYHNFPNAYLVDLDQIVSSFGKRYFSDDSVWSLDETAPVLGVFLIPTRWKLTVHSVQNRVKAKCQQESIAGPSFLNSR